MKILCFVLALLSPFGAQAWSLAEVQNQLASQEVVRAHFEQERWISTMPQPLRSSGHLVVSRTQGLWWQQEKPFALKLILTDERMMQQVAGQPPQIMTAQSSPQLFHIIQLLRAVIQADRKSLEQSFTLLFQDLGSQGWQLDLTPKGQPLDRLFKTITLTGQAQLQGVVLNDRQGDRTEIRFSQHVLSPSELSHEETQQFRF
jgi:hypothetical protein